jgi:hypothetical protein
MNKTYIVRLTDDERQGLLQLTWSLANSVHSLNCTQEDIRVR